MSHRKSHGCISARRYELISDYTTYATHNTVSHKISIQWANTGQPAEVITGQQMYFNYSITAYDKNWKLSGHSLSLGNSMKFLLIMYSKFIWSNLIWPDRCLFWLENVWWLVLQYLSFLKYSKKLLTAAMLGKHLLIPCFLSPAPIIFTQPHR